MRIPRTLRQWEDFNRGLREGRILAYNGYGLGHYQSDNEYWQAGKVQGYNEVIVAGLRGVYWRWAYVA